MKYGRLTTIHIFQNIILRVKSVEFTRILCVRCGFCVFSAVLSSLFSLLFPLEVEVNFTSLVHEKIVCFLSRHELGMPVIRLAVDAK